MTITASIEQKSNFSPITKTFNSVKEIEALLAEVKAQKPVFTGATLSFNSEAELHDVLAALAAYHDKMPRVCDTNTAPKFGLYAYTGNARATVRRVLPGLLAQIGIDADTTQLNGPGSDYAEPEVEEEAEVEEAVA